MPKRKLASSGSEPAAERSPGTKARVAVLDLGSTSFNLLVADATGDGGIERVERRREMLRLGATLDSSGSIPEAVCESAVETAASLHRTAHALGVDLVVPIATAALRDARNGVELSHRIDQVLDVPLRVLSGEQEARLIFAAFAHRVPLSDQPALGIDLGGGSCELALGNRWDITWETTLRIGVARLDAEIGMRGSPRKRWKALRKRVELALARHREVLAGPSGRVCVASGGTVRGLARVLEARRDDDLAGGLRIQADELRELAAELMASTPEERLAMPGMKRGRADLMPTGGAVVDALVSALDIEEITVCDWGLREGAVLEAIGLVDVV